ncbi:hypothetical protein E4634_03755 [Mangrovimicrobium sediminis]|uniref:Uncharacterized protein n=1 Tax=Mangrovimicrobium sediminis TaxID=2562682 RepID=A0A4Z0M6I7_9GAMM|nr:hypothetical protein [Haliea sp. SAOS-164]TGD75131.1 hypothetical protein E4634_03755 [Haliea sp. SAOS-164]
MRHPNPKAMGYATQVEPQQRQESRPVSHENVNGMSIHQRITAILNPKPEAHLFEAEVTPTPTVADEGGEIGELEYELARAEKALHEAQSRVDSLRARLASAQGRPRALV